LASRNTSVHWTCREISISHSPAAFTRSDVAVWLLGDAGPPPNPSGIADEAARRRGRARHLPRAAAYAPAVPFLELTSNFGTLSFFETTTLDGGPRYARPIDEFLRMSWNQEQRR